MTVTDTAGNPATVSITFPMVAKGDQTLTGFRYSSSAVTFGSTAPTVLAPGGVQTTLSYSATPSTVCTVGASTGVLTLVGAGSCEITARAASTDNYNEATATFTVTVQSVGTLALNLDTIAGDDVVNLAEKTAGFTISGDTGSEAGVAVSVTIGSQSPLTATTDSDGAWSVSVPANAAYLTGTSVAVSVSASKTGFTSPSAVTRTLAVDLGGNTGNTGTPPPPPPVMNAAPVFRFAAVTRSFVEHVGDAGIGAAVDIGAPITATDVDTTTLTYTLEGPDAAFFDHRLAPAANSARSPA